MTSLPLRVVPTANVIPHEQVDPRRVNRLLTRLQADGILVNPPIVMEMDSQYVVLDGATRCMALKQLGYPDMIVQVISPAAEVQLYTWHHVLCRVSVDALRAALINLPAVTLVEINLEQMLDQSVEYEGICYLQLVTGQVLVVQPTAGQSHLEALNLVTQTYLQMSHVHRTINHKLMNLQQEYPDMAALVIFPPYTVDQVLQLAQSETVFPAGITRFIIPGRILRLNAELAPLKSNRSLQEKNQWLQDMLRDKLHKGKIRYYAEPVYLLDE